MKDYIISEYESELLDINTNNGLKKYQSLIFGLYPSRRYGGMILLAGQNHSLYYPFLSPNILRALFYRRSGIAKSIQIRKDFKGPVNSIKIQAEIVRCADKELYSSVLDRGLSFKESLESPVIISEIIRKLRLLIKRLKYWNHLWVIVDNRRIRDIVSHYAKEVNRNSTFFRFVGNKKFLAKEIATISVIKNLSENRLFLKEKQ